MKAFMLLFMLVFSCAFGQFQNINPVSIVISKTGRVWMDRNLGAQRPAVNSKDSKAFGDLYQWGRPKDGHQIRSSKLQQLKSKSSLPSRAKQNGWPKWNHGNFIMRRVPWNLH